MSRDLEFVGGGTTVSPASKRQVRMHALGWLQRNSLWYLFLLPSILLLFTFVAVPLVETLNLSVYEWDGIAPQEFVGLDNFEDMLKDRFFWQAIRHSLQFASIVTAGTVAIGLLLAVAISRRVVGASVFRVLFYIPVMIPLTVSGILWARLYETNFGVINTVLRGVGLDALARSWLGDTQLSLWSVIFTTIWQYAGLPMVVLLAAIENIPDEIHEAATLDGVNEWQRLRFIILPLIRPVLISIAVLMFIVTLKIFDIVWVMTRGGPAESSSVIGTFLFRQGFEINEYGYASAVAVGMLVLIFAITYAQQRLLKVEAVDHD